MLDVFNIATPQGCNIQIFYGGGLSTNTTNTKSWNKPRGVSNVYMLLIGGGGNGDGTSGGGSGAVTVWYGSALHVPDFLEIRVSREGGASEVFYRTSSGANILLTGDPGSNNTAGSAMTANQFCASGYFQSIAGQIGSATTQSASGTTFLSGGGAGPSITANYGNVTTGSGYFQMQPIIVGLGGAANQKGGIGCGGGATLGTIGGPGMVLIASW